MNIAILGYGVVGKGVEAIAEEKGINVAYILMRDIDELTKGNMTRSLDEILDDEKVDCVIECIGGDEPAHSYVVRAMKKGKNVVSSNKKMLVRHLKELVSLAEEQNVTLLCSAACGGGIPWIRELSKIKEGEEIYSFKGIMNGTSNYILDKMHKEGSAFSMALNNAQKLGYAESDPSDDIDGIDTANKVVLSAAMAFDKCFELEDVFIRGIRNFDLKDLEYAKANGYKCVLLGKGRDLDGTTSLSVLPTFVKKDSILGSIADNYNCFISDSKDLSDLFFIGQGAGSLPTASNVIRDVLSLDDPYHFEFRNEALIDHSKDKAVYYIRSQNQIDPLYVDEKIDADTYVSKPISIEVLKTIIGDNDFVGEIEHD